MPKEGQSQKPTLNEKLSELQRKLSFFRLLQANLIYVIFLVSIGLLYIWNSHFAEKQVRKAEQLQRELRDLKSEYMTLNAQLSNARQQSEIAKRVSSMGLEELKAPPYKLPDTNNP